MRSKNRPAPAAVTAVAIACAVSIPLFTTSTAMAQDAVQWRVEDGGNGHWYMATSDTVSDFWLAQASAEAAGGHLVTLTSAEENQFISQLAPGDFLLGGYQDLDSPEYAEPNGGWRWVTSEAWQYTAWQSGEPQNGGSTNEERGEHYLAWWRFGMAWNNRWNDAGNVQNHRTIIEWSADCNNDGIVDYGQAFTAPSPTAMATSYPTNAT